MGKTKPSKKTGKVEIEAKPQNTDSILSLIGKNQSKELDNNNSEKSVKSSNTEISSKEASNKDIKESKATVKSSKNKQKGKTLQKSQNKEEYHTDLQTLLPTELETGITEIPETKGQYLEMNPITK